MTRGTPMRFSNLPAYAFPRLRTLVDGVAPGGTVIDMTIGEPKHPFPSWITEIIQRETAGFNRYPPNDGTAELRAAIAAWIARRYNVDKDPAHEIVPVNGTREGLFNTALALCPSQKNGKKPVILTPNPFYQVYMMAALAVDAEPVYVPATAETGFLPDYSAVDPKLLERTAIAYICSPANPQGSIADEAYWVTLLDLAERYNFKIFADECYSEIYRDAPPQGILAASAAYDPERVIAFHSLSKRSNLPGLRSGFITGGPNSIQRAKQLRAYAGAPLPLPLQHAATAAWQDETHVIKNRALYREKFDIADEVFADVRGYHSPQAGFFLWLPVEDGEKAAVKLWQETGVKALPGAYLAQGPKNDNPGHGYIRVALVAPKEETQAGLRALHACLYTK